MSYTPVPSTPVPSPAVPHAGGPSSAVPHDGGPSGAVTPGAGPSDGTDRRHHPESGQATAEYALVMLAAAALAGLLVAWASGTGGISRLLTAVMDELIAQV